MSTPLERLRKAAVVHPGCKHRDEPWPVPVNPLELQLLLGLVDYQKELLDQEYYTKVTNASVLEKRWEELAE